MEYGFRKLALIPSGVLNLYMNLVSIYEWMKMEPELAFYFPTLHREYRSKEHWRKRWWKYFFPLRFGPSEVCWCRQTSHSHHEMAVRWRRRSLQDKANNCLPQIFSFLSFSKASRTMTNSSVLLPPLRCCGAHKFFLDRLHLREQPSPSQFFVQAK